MKNTNFKKAGIARQSLENVKGGIAGVERICPRCGGTLWRSTELEKPGDPKKMECIKCGYILIIPPSV